MPKVICVQVIYNNKKWIEACFGALFNQTFKDFHVVAVIAGNEDGSKELLKEKFPKVEIIDPGYNIGFAKGHNLVFERYLVSRLSPPKLGGEDEARPYQEGEKRLGSFQPGEGKVPEFFQLVNPDLIMQPDYIEKMLEAFKDEKVGAATGKLLKIEDVNQNNSSPSFLNLPGGQTGRGMGGVLDTTGVTITKSGRARDRGQWEEDKGQYDLFTDVSAVSGAGAMYRTTALRAVAVESQMLKEASDNLSYPTLHEGWGTLPKLGEGNMEYFDEDFHSYWEDVDLAWRMANKGWKCKYVPEAVAFHGRTAGSSKNGYLNVPDFIRHHYKLSPRIRQLNWTNHIYMYVKNSKWFYPQFFVREFFMLIYILLFEPGTLKVFPELVKTLPKMWRKRKTILSE